MSSVRFIVLLSVICQSFGFSNTGASVQLFEWSWNEIASECENFLGPKGFKSVQISPPTEHIEGSQWWTRYQPVTYKIISRSGNEDQFVDMIRRCSAKNVSIIVDAVINHMAAGSGTGIAGSKYGSRSYPFYSPNDFHHDTNNVYTNCEVSNYNDKHSVQFCDLVGLPDLMTSSSYVQSQIVAYLKNVHSLGAKGIRIDAAKHQDATELSGITKQLPSDFYIGQEVIGQPGEAVQPKEYYSLGQVSEFQFANYLDDNIVPENKMNELQSLGEAWGLMPEKNAVVFMDK
jgi:alpha-amylase